MAAPSNLGNGCSNTTATGNITLTSSSPRYQRIDPGGSHRDVTLPAESFGDWFKFMNLADAAENLVIKDDGGNTIVTINQNEASEVSCDGTNWRHMGVVTIAQT